MGTVDALCMSCNAVIQWSPGTPRICPQGCPETRPACPTCDELITDGACGCATVADTSGEVEVLKGALSRVAEGPDLAALEHAAILAVRRHQDTRATLKHAEHAERDARNAASEAAFAYNNAWRRKVELIEQS